MTFHEPMKHFCCWPFWGSVSPYVTLTPQHSRDEFDEGLAGELQTKMVPLEEGGSEHGDQSEVLGNWVG